MMKTFFSDTDFACSDSALEFPELRSRGHGTRHGHGNSDYRAFPLGKN